MVIVTSHITLDLGTLYMLHYWDKADQPKGGVPYIMTPSKRLLDKGYTPRSKKDVRELIEDTTYPRDVHVTLHTPAKS